jgi:hypothetical protein
MNLGAQGFFNAGGRSHLIVDSEYQDGSPTIVSGRFALQDGFVFIPTGSNNELWLESCNLGNVSYSTWPGGSCSKWTVNPCPKDKDRNKNKYDGNNNGSRGNNNVSSEDVFFINEGITIIPNPSNGIFVLQSNFKELLSTDQVVIYNVLGTIIYNTNLLQELPIDLSSQPKGIYFVKVQSADKIYTEKVVVQ